MKKSFLIYLTSLLISSTSFGQLDEISKVKDWTFFGIDYRECYFITSSDFIDTDNLLVQVKAWNNLLYNEEDKYIVKTLKNKDVNLSTEILKNLNSEIDVKDRVSNDKSLFKHLDSEMVAKIVSDYEIPDDLSGIGLVFIAESYSKPEVLGAYYVTFFDIKTKKVLGSERMTGKAKGFGLRNYWANSFYVVLKELGKKYQ